MNLSNSNAIQRLNKGPLGRWYYPRELKGLIYRNTGGVISTITPTKITETNEYWDEYWEEKDLQETVTCVVYDKLQVWGRVLPKEIYPEYYL